MGNNNFCFLGEASSCVPVDGNWAFLVSDLNFQVPMILPERIVAIGMLCGRSGGEWSFGVKGIHEVVRICVF